MNLYIFIISVVRPAGTRNPRVRVRVQKCTRGFARGRVFFQSRGFACGRVFAKPAPTPAGALPGSAAQLADQNVDRLYASERDCTT